MSFVITKSVSFEVKVQNDCVWTEVGRGRAKIRKIVLGGTSKLDDKNYKVVLSGSPMLGQRKLRGPIVVKRKMVKVLYTTGWRLSKYA